jgi:hypothetical protein
VSAYKLCFVFAFGFLTTASADVLIDTLSPLAVMPLPGGQSTSYVPLDANPPYIYGAFTVEEQFNFDNQNPNCFLSSVSLSLDQYADNGSISVQLFDSDGLYPANLLAVLNGPANPGAGISTFTPSTPIDLQNASSGDVGYSIVVSGTGYGWNITSVPPWNGQDPTAEIYWVADYDNGAGQVESFDGGSNTPNAAGGGTFALAI